jgi:hypothetical protein
MFLVLLLHVSLAFSQSALLPPAVRASAVAEAAAIWAPRGVLVDACEPRSPIVLTVVAAAPAPARSLGKPLGAIVFDAGGTPQPRILLYMSEILTLVRSARFLGVDESHWPPGLRETIVGRAVGRVLAHEIGHYVLRTRNHTEDGLMRSFQRPDDLVGVPRVGFASGRIDDADVMRRESGAGESKQEERRGDVDGSRAARAHTGADASRARR